MNVDHRSEHPGQVQAGTRLWFGVEVEGMYRGLAAAFVAAKLDGHELSKLLRTVKSSAHVVFFTETFDDWEWAAKHVFPHLKPLVRLCAGRYPHQVGDFIVQRRKWTRHVSMIVRLFSEFDWHALSSEDQVSIGKPYDLLTFPARSGIATIPSDYHNDKG